MPQRLPAGPWTATGPPRKDSGAEAPTRFSTEYPPSKPTMFPSKFRTGPEVLQLPPPHWAWLWQAAPGVGPPMHVLIASRVQVPPGHWEIGRASCRERGEMWGEGK